MGKLKQLLKTRIFTSMRPFFAVSGIYMLLLVVLKVVEFCLLDISADNRFQLLVNAEVYNIILASWTVLGLSVLYYVVQLLSRRVAIFLFAIIFAILFLSEVGLLFYSMHNGFLLGSELVARPLSETWMAIRGAVGIVLPIVLPIVLVAGFVALALWRAGRPSGVVWVVPVLAVIFALLSLCFKTSNLVYPKYNYFILNKTHYLCVDSYNYIRHSKHLANGAVAYDEALVADLHATHPEWGMPINPVYPLERQFAPDTFLNTYFMDLEPGVQSPNVVVVIVESLGHEYMGTGAMPFVDSLAATGLYWSNCLSTTQRSYGAIPAITGSVGGPKCFQFGSMPAHNSLVSLLRKAGYTTRSYFSGDYTFDCIYDYLTAQHIDRMVTSYDEYSALPASRRPNWWGYNDDTLFARTFRDMCEDKSTDTCPHFSLITTLTMHDNLRLADQALQSKYERRTANLSACTPLVAASFPAALFTDDCLRSFIQSYSRRPDFRNTIFVVTGDHSSGHQGGDKLACHRVPLIIWSPLVKRPAHFNHVVTHNDIAPALYSLLTGRYGLEPYPTIHWLGDGLAPTPKTLLIVNYMRDITEIIYHNYYYQAASTLGSEALYSFGTDMQLTPCDDTLAMAECRRQLQLMKYLYAYTYNSDHLTAHPVYSNHYTLFSHLKHTEPIEYFNPDAPPSVTGCIDYQLLPPTLLRDAKGYSSVRVKVEADVTIRDSLQILQFPDLRFCFEGDQLVSERERLSKFLSGNPCRTTGTFHLALAKEFRLGAAPSTLSVLLTTPWNDDDWIPAVHLTLDNVNITVEYAK